MTVQRLSSTEFRRRYAQLDGPHEVTALGRVIGTWLPVRVRPSASSASPRRASEAAESEGLRPVAPASTGDPQRGSSEAEHLAHTQEVAGSKPAPATTRLAKSRKG